MIKVDVVMYKHYQQLDRDMPLWAPMLNEMSDKQIKFNLSKHISNYYGFRGDREIIAKIIVIYADEQNRRLRAKVDT